MQSSTVWIVVGVLVALWLLGAYNRLMRLKQSVVQALSAVQVAVDRELAQVLSLVQDPLMTSEQAALDWLHLGAAVQQVHMQATHAAQQPFEAQRLTDWTQAHNGLAALCHALDSAGATPAAAPVLQVWMQQRQQLLMLVAHATTRYNQAVSEYNQACAQWPARLLTQAAGFQPATQLDFKVTAASMTLLTTTLTKAQMAPDDVSKASPIEPRS